jgi:hypothetical protein
MTRRHWFGSLLAALAGAWGAARARAVPRSPAPRRTPPWPPRHPAECGSFHYDASNAVGAACEGPGMVTTYVYHAAGALGPRQGR